MTRRPLGFGIVGCGVIAPTHADAVKANGGRVVATYDVVPECAAALAERCGARACATLDELLADPGVDVVTIATPSGAHGEVAIAAAAACKHLLVEKPLDVSVERAREIVRAADENGVTLSVVSQHRFDDSTIAAKRAIEAGALGRPVFAEAEVLWHRSQEYYDRDAWRGTWRLDGGGALMNQAIHSVDLLRYLAGDVATVRGLTALRGHERIEVEDVAVAALTFRSGALGVLVATTAATPGFGARIEVYGDRGAARIEDDRLVYLTAAGAGTGAAARDAEAPTAFADPAAVSGQGHGRQVADLIEAIELGRPPLVDGAEGVKSLELVLAVYESARTGREVALDSVSQP